MRDKPETGLDIAIRDLEVEERDLERARRQGKRRRVLETVLGGLVSVLSFVIGYDLAPGPPDHIASVYPYAGAMLASSIPLNRGNLTHAVNRRAGKRRLMAIGIAFVVLISGVAGYLLGLAAGHDSFGVGVKYGVYSANRPAIICNVYGK